MEQILAQYQNYLNVKFTEMKVDLPSGNSPSDVRERLTATANYLIAIANVANEKASEILQENNSEALRNELIKIGNETVQSYTVQSYNNG